MIISNNLVNKMPIPDDTIIRVNLAWIKSYEEAEAVISSSGHSVYLDYPDGRKKPPRGVLSLKEAIKLARLPEVLYFAVSNCESVERINEIREQLWDVEFVPKIETVAGVAGMDEMIKAGIKTFMLDKEDLYTDVQGDADRFEELVNEARGYSDRAKILELKGVIFD